MVACRYISSTPFKKNASGSHNKTGKNYHGKSSYRLS